MTPIQPHADIKLQVLLCTFGRRAGDIDLRGLPVLEGVEYIVCVQNPDGIAVDTSALDARNDISVHFFADRGISRNRNHAFDLATAPLLQITDDDVALDPSALRRLVDEFDARPEVDIIATRSDIPEYRIYPPDGHDLTRPYSVYSPISFEIALRRDALLRTGLRFYPDAGVGCDYITCAEEELFLNRALHSGLRGRFVDIVLSHHRGTTTSVRAAGQPGTLRAKGMLMRVKRGDMAALMRLPVEARRAPVSFFTALGYLWDGFVYAGKHRKEL